MCVPGVWTIGFAARQTFPIKRFGFRKPLLPAQRAGEGAQRYLHILATTRVLAPKCQRLAKAGFGFNQVALVEESVTATVKVAFGRIINPGGPAEKLEGPVADIFRL